MSASTSRTNFGRLQSVFEGARLASSEDQGAGQVDVEDRLKTTEGDPCADHEPHPVELLVSEVLLGFGEPGVVDAQMIERELLGVLNSDAVGLGVAGPTRPFRHVVVVVLGELVLRQLRNPGLQSDIANVDFGDPFAHQLPRAG
jgi:hypothetical protein